MSPDRGGYSSSFRLMALDDFAGVSMPSCAGARPTWILCGRLLAQQSHEPINQTATDHHGPVPDIQIEKPAVGRYKGETHARPSAEDQPTADIITVTHYCLRETIDHCQN
jgi:hypothetical protein